MSEQRCGTCKWSKWQLTEKGNVRRSLYGECTSPFQKPSHPSCYSITFHKSVIWPNTGETCPTYEAKPCQK